MAFVPRLTFSESELYTNKYFADGQKEWGVFKMPNCTCYAWCRFYEILGSWPTLCESDAKDWWYYTKDGYERGQTPALGAVAVYDYPEYPSKAGHVMIVEEIDSEGNITTSQSGWGASSYFWTGKYYKSNNYSYSGSSGRSRLLGFIYNPGAGTPGITDVSSANKLLQFLQEVEKHVGEGGDWTWRVSGLSRGEPWCVAFINACAKTVGGLAKIITVKYGTGTIKEGLDSGGGTWIPGPVHGQTPTPQPGDLIEYSWDCDVSNGTDYTGDHVAVVTEVNGDTVTTIGGNEGGSDPLNNKVMKSTKSITYGCILGYYRPNWSLVGGMLTSAYGGYNLKYTHLNDRNDAMIRDVCYLDSSYNLSLSNTTGIEISAVNYTTMLVGLLAMIGDPINPSVSYMSVNTGLSGTNADGSGIENSNARNIFSLLTGKGLNAAQAIGILANIQRESSFNPGSIGDSGTSFGLCQWHADRGDSMKSHCGADWATDISGQIDYLFVELNGRYSSVLSSIKSECSLETEDSAKRAAEIFVRQFEIPANVDNEVIIRQGYVSTLWSQVVVTGTSNYSTLLAPTASSMVTTSVSAPSSSGGQFYIQDSQLEVPADPTYFGHRVTNITATERAAIIWTIDGEFGSDLTGAILIAQVVRDIHDYTKMHGAPTTITYEYVIRNAFAQPYWQKGAADPNYDFTQMEANRRYSYKAFQYVFEQGNSAVRHKLAFEGTAEVDFSIYRAYVVYKYYLQSWGVLWSGFVWGIDIYGDYVNPDSASDMLLRSSSGPGTSGITSGEITYRGIPVTPATTPEEFRDLMRERVVSLLKTGSVSDSTASSSPITDEEKEFVISISHPDDKYHGRPIDLTDKQRKRIALACLGEFSVQSSGMYEVWCCLCQYIRDRVDYKGFKYEGIGASWLGSAYSAKVQSSYGNKSYDEIVKMHPDLGNAITHVFDDGGSAFQGFCGGYADKNDEVSASRYGYLDKNGVPGCVRYVMWTTDCDGHENDHDLINLDKYTNADDNLWFYACWPGKATHLGVSIGTYKNGWRGSSEDSDSEYYSSSDALSPKEHTMSAGKYSGGKSNWNYWIYQPNRKKGSKLPLLVYLHGSGGAGNNINILINQEPGMANMIYHEKIFPNMVVIAPQSPSGWSNGNEDLAGFISWAIEEYDIDSKHVLISGFSAGGWGLFTTLISHQDLFCAAVPVAVSYYADKCKDIKIPVRIYQGTADTTMGGVTTVNKIAEVINSNGGNCEVIAMEGITHNCSQDILFDEKWGYWDWIEQKLGIVRKVF